MAAEVPTYRELINPTLDALRQAGGSASNDEITNLAIDITGLPEQVVNQSHGGGRQTELEYRLAWARTLLKNYGLITNSARGIWSLTPKGREQTSIDPAEVYRAYIRTLGNQAVAVDVGEQDGADTDDKPTERTWQEQLIETVHALSPDAFERLCQRMLRESGFIEFAVTGRSGDGGIDGHGIIRMGGLISFPVLFQCKRYSGSVTPSIVRDFRGAMAGRSEKGLLITTGTFTREARREATRDGAPPLDLIDGELLAEKLKELGLGVKTEMVEQVTIDTEWFTGV